MLPDPGTTHITADSEKTLTVLAGYIEQFLTAWESGGGPPDLRSFLPEEHENRRLVLIELIKVDLEYRWQHAQQPKHLTDYLREFPELAEHGVPVDLIYEEYHIRRHCGLAVDPREYLERFPAQAEEIGRLLGLTGDYGSTAVHRDSGKRHVKELLAGQQVDEFDLLAQLGEGAFARVFLARQRSMQRLVALKVSADSGSEPQVLAQFDHDYIVRVYDHRVLPDRKLRLLYMQYLPAGSLQDVIRLRRAQGEAAVSGRLLLEAVDAALTARGESRPVESTLAERLTAMTWPEVVCWIGACLARGLEHAHRRGILHRDVKPANVLLTAEGIPKLADFNISCSSNLPGASAAAYFGGSLAYMSPEQLEACNPAHPRQPASLDERADLYSLGILLWELLTGTRPFREDPQPGGWADTLAMMTENRRGGLGDDILKQLPADSPPGLIDVLRKCLAPEPDARWTSGGELARQLDFCQKRAVQELLHPPPASWPSRLKPHFVAAVVIATGLPNVLAGAFNLAYNNTEIVKHLHGAEDAFWMIVTCVNAVAYPIGLGLAGWIAYSIVRGAGGGPDVSLGFVGPKATRRERCLALGHAAAVICVGLWVLAGIVYPVCMHLLAGPMPVAVYVHFFGSLLLCGLVAAAYPFFAVTCLSIRAVFPDLLRGEPLTPDEGRAVHTLRQRARRYLVSAVSVPLLAVLALASMDVKSKFPLLALSAASLVGFGLVFRCFQRLEADAAVLQDILGHNPDTSSR